jgi:hypothetical protein
MWPRVRLSYLSRVVGSTLSMSKWRSSSWSIVARARALRRASTSASSLVRAFSAWVEAVGPAGMVLVRYTRRPETGSTPA